VVAVVGMLDRKRPAALAGALATVVGRWVVTGTSGERAVEPSRLACELGVAAIVEPRLAAAIARARELAGPRGLVCVCGSLRVVADAMRVCGRRRIEVV
jgi:folylpolyglutamate synthase/dihydropteroate synthase